MPLHGLANLAAYSVFN